MWHPHEAGALPKSAERVHEAGELLWLCEPDRLPLLLRVLALKKLRNLHGGQQGGGGTMGEKGRGVGARMALRTMRRTWPSR